MYQNLANCLQIGNPIHHLEIITISSQFTNAASAKMVIISIFHLLNVQFFICYLYIRIIIRSFVCLCSLFITFIWKMFFFYFVFKSIQAMTVQSLKNRDDWHWTGAVLLSGAAFTSPDRTPLDMKNHHSHHNVRWFILNGVSHWK